MKLNKEGRDALRRQIEERLKTVPEGQKVSIEKDLLEELLFEKFKYKDTTIKIPIWSGKFLSKIKLSEVSFDNAVWNIDLFIEMAKMYIDKNIELSSINPTIDFSNTDVNIDFSKSYVFEDDDLRISNCNFKNVDLSNAHVEKIISFSNCNFSNTKSNIFLEREDNEMFFINNCDFSNNDYSSTEIDSISFGPCETCGILDCNFSNTGLKIKYDKPTISSRQYNELYQKRMRMLSRIDLTDDEKTELEEIKKVANDYNGLLLGASHELSSHIKKGFLDGCYIDGKLIHSKEERQQIAEQKRQEYKDYINDLAASAITSSDGDNNRFHK